MKVTASIMLTIIPRMSHSFLFIAFMVSVYGVACGTQAGEITVAINDHAAFPESEKQSLSTAIAGRSLQPVILGAEAPSNGAPITGPVASAGPQGTDSSLKSNLAACSAVTPCPSFSPCSEDSPLSGIHACDSPHSLHDSDQSLADRRQRANATCPLEEDYFLMTRVLPSHCGASTEFVRRCVGAPGRIEDSAA